MIISITIAIFLLTIFVGVPVAYALGVGSLSYILLSGELSYLTNMPQRMYVAVDNFSLLAIPFFMLVGELMNSGGITKRIIHFFRTLLGHVHGSLAFVNIGASGFLASIIGSANAVASITSTSIVPEMKKNGYNNEYSSGISAAASILGPIIPPSIIFILYAIAAGISVSALFIAGILPGILLMSALALVSYIYARKHNFKRDPRAPISEMFKAFLSAFPALIIPAGIMGGIITGVVTATEAGVIGCLIAFIVGKFVYKELDWKAIPRMFTRAGILTATIMIIAATATLFGWVMAIEQIPQKLAEVILSISDNPIVLLILINVILIIVGMFLEALSAILILVPVFMPIIAQIGIDPLHFGLIMCFNLAIGMLTPPMGLSLFIVSGITKVPLDRLVRSTAPFLAAAIAVLLIITYVPEFSLFLPSLFE